MDFSCALHCQLMKLPEWTLNQDKLYRCLIDCPSGQTCPEAGVIEQVVRGSLGCDPTCPIDWSCATLPAGKAAAKAIDWNAILLLIETLLPVIIPFLHP